MSNTIKCLTTLFLFSVLICNAQRENARWRALFSTGMNFASKNGFVEDFEAKTPNLPTINLGLQHMLSKQFGARLDFSFNRFKNDASVATEYKVNYSRINLQLVYDASYNLEFLPDYVGLLAHAGPGYSFAKPLSPVAHNKQSYLNVTGGVELSYTLSRKVAVFVDVSYIYGFTKLEDYNPSLNGLGAFNGNVITSTVGLSIALSGCYTCN